MLLKGQNSAINPSLDSAFGKPINITLTLDAIVEKLANEVPQKVPSQKQELEAIAPLVNLTSAPTGNILAIQNTVTGLVHFVSNGVESCFKAVGDVAKEIKDAGDWIVTHFATAQTNLANDVALGIANRIDAKAKTESLLKMSPGSYTTSATNSDFAEAKNKRVLLFVHGIFSSIEAAFSGLSADGNTTMQTLCSQYDGLVFGFDHWTLAKRPLTNAVDLLNLIPAGSNWELDIVCHSRGGLVVRSLLANNASAAAEDQDAFDKIYSLREGRIKSVNSVMFVAAANQGSPLATKDRIGDLFNVLVGLASKTTGLMPQLVVDAAVQLLDAFSELPSVIDLAPGSPLIETLNGGTMIESKNPILGARANYTLGASNPLLDVAVLADKALMEEPNDLVVPYEGVSLIPAVAGPQDTQYSSDGSGQDSVWHTEFFDPPQTTIQTVLRGLFAAGKSS